MSSSETRRPAFAAALAAGLLSLGGVAGADVDLSTLQVIPQRGQSAEQTRRDRYECHNWAVEQTGSAPVSPASSDEDAAAERQRRVDRVIAGAGIGAVAGGLVSAVGDHHSPGGMLAGAAIGAAVGAATGRDGSREEEQDPAADDPYLRALDACMEGRGYMLALPLSAASKS
jgi:hypothetical protein